MSLFCLIECCGAKEQEVVAVVAHQRHCYEQEYDAAHTAGRVDKFMQRYGNRKKK